MASLFCFKNIDRSIVVYPDTDPLPIPSLDPGRSVTKTKCSRSVTDVGTNTSGVLEFKVKSGYPVIYDFGAMETDIVLDINIPFVYKATRDALRQICSMSATANSSYPGAGCIWWYHYIDNKDFLCAVDSMEFPVYQGTTDVFSCKAKLLPIREPWSYNKLTGTWLVPSPID
jgi:hypothetical protein